MRKVLFHIHLSFLRKQVDKSNQSGIIFNNQIWKPMIKRSNLSDQLSESRGWWERGSQRIGEWTYEGGRKRKRVEADGERTRYQSVTVWLYSG